MTKAKIVKSLPNSFLHYTLTDISQVQLSMLTTNLQKGLNHPDFDKSYLKLQLQQIQDSAHTNKSILKEWSALSYTQYLTHTCHALQTIHKLNIKFLRPLNNWSITTSFLGTSLNLILLSHHRCTHLKKTLNSHGIVCIEQFMDFRNKELLEQQNFHHNIKKIPRGRIPKCF